MPDFDFSVPFRLTVEINISGLETLGKEIKTIFGWRNNNHPNKPGVKLVLDTRTTTRNSPTWIFFAWTEDGFFKRYDHNLNAAYTVKIDGTTTYKIEFFWQSQKFGFQLGEDVLRSWTNVIVGFGKKFTDEKETCEGFQGSIKFDKNPLSNLIIKKARENIEKNIILKTERIKFEELFPNLPWKVTTFSLRETSKYLFEIWCTLII